MKIINKGLSAIALSLVAHVATIFKASFIWGSYASFFSLSHCMNPVIGKRGGSMLGLLYYGVRTLIFMGAAGSFSFYYLAHHLPTLSGTLYASVIYDTSTSKTIARRYMLAAACLGCILLFSVHPIGFAAWPYACLWLLPLANALILHNNMFINALASTFAAHAVGSVLWLYTVNSLTPALWISLIPVVCLERFVFAIGACALDWLYGYYLERKPAPALTKRRKAIQ